MNIPGTRFHLVDNDGVYSVQSNLADKECLLIGPVDFDTARRVYLSIERSWENDEKWRSGQTEDTTTIYPAQTKREAVACGPV